MTQSYALSFVSRSLSFLLLFSGISFAADKPGYTIEIKVTSGDEEPRISSVSGVALNQSDQVTLPVVLSHVELPATVELHFDLPARAVYVEIMDLQLATKLESGGLVKREFFEGCLYFEWGKELVLCQTPTEKISMTATGPDVQGPEIVDGMLSKEEVGKLEAEMRVDERRVFGTVYNPTEFEIHEIRVRVSVPAKDGVAGVDRLYRSLTRLHPLTSDTFQIDTRIPEMPEGTEYKLEIESAKGR